VDAGLLKPEVGKGASNHGKNSAEHDAKLEKALEKKEKVGNISLSNRVVRLYGNVHVFDVPCRRGRSAS
jgi:hypothetical protein